MEGAMVRVGSVVVDDEVEESDEVEGDVLE